MFTCPKSKNHNEICIVWYELGRDDCPNVKKSTSTCRCEHFFGQWNSHLDPKFKNKQSKEEGCQQGKWAPQQEKRVTGAGPPWIPSRAMARARGPTPSTANGTRTTSPIHPNPRIVLLVSFPWPLPQQRARIARRSRLRHVRVGLCSPKLPIRFAHSCFLTWFPLLAVATIDLAVTGGPENLHIVHRFSRLGE